jgi:GPH family glycoside/pentoside/hexuronide:cation symporter
MLLIASQLYTQTTLNYLYKDYFRQPSLYSLVTICTYAPMVLLLPFLGGLVRRFGKKGVCAGGMLLSCAANLLLWLARTQNPYVFMALCFLSGLGQTFFVMEVWAMATDVIDYQEYLSGRRAEGTCYAFFNFTRKLGHTAAGGAGSMMLGAIGYDVKNTLTAQPPRVVRGMYTVATLVPAAAYLLMFLLLGLLYPLGQEQVTETQQSLARLRAGKQAAE